MVILIKSGPVLQACLHSGIKLLGAIKTSVSRLAAPIMQKTSELAGNEAHANSIA
ncbi:hypothetical protein [Bartonella machadoae]|uniref:hypothetical protein n=1 Tax=Bartonella machadoae TaxID=2893471 RepID=UPI001F4D25DF|nr:hypothetical protein [Bartonella machadoae]UNE53570.1 hypothetical protein LNM86_07830 [Bartonella machadoae]